MEVKPQKETFKELNVDMSCMDLPVQEGGPVRARRKLVERKNFMPEPVAPPEEVEAEMARSGWNWCTEERKLLDTNAVAWRHGIGSWVWEGSRGAPVVRDAQDWSEARATLMRSQSLPQVL